MSATESIAGRAEHSDGDLKVSVIMAVYNAESYLQEAIDSVLEQSYADFEFIIINDGSTDKCSRILHTYDDERIRLVERENRGLATSLNEAIGISRGRYIARMDHDDICLPERLERQLDYMEKNPEVGILGAQAYLIDEAGNRIGATCHPVSEKAIRRCLEFVCPMTHPTYFVRKEVYRQVDGYRNIRIEDYDFLLRALENGVVIRNLQDKLLLYRTVSSGMSLSNLQRTISLWTLVRKAHRLRISGASDDKIFRERSSLNNEQSTWFQFVSEMKYALSAKKNQGNWLFRSLIYAAIGFVSLMHAQLFLFEFSYWRSKMITWYYG